MNTWFALAENIAAGWGIYTFLTDAIQRKHLWCEYKIPSDTKSDIFFMFSYVTVWPRSMHWLLRMVPDRFSKIQPKPKTWLKNISGFHVQNYWDGFFSCIYQFHVINKLSTMSWASWKTIRFMTRLIFER